MRSRACNQPVPAHGGSTCTKDDSSGSLGEETRRCGERSCTSGEFRLKPNELIVHVKNCILIIDPHSLVLLLLL